MCLSYRLAFSQVVDRETVCETSHRMLRILDAHFCASFGHFLDFFHWECPIEELGLGTAAYYSPFVYMVLRRVVELEFQDLELVTTATTNAELHFDDVVSLDSLAETSGI